MVTGSAHSAASRDDPRPGVPSEAHVQRWLEQACDSRVHAEIADIYREADAAVAVERPLCLASGHCCHFDDFGHDLFVTAIEAAWFLVNIGRHDAGFIPTRALHATAPDADPSRGPLPRPLPLLHQSAKSHATRTCPWLEDRLCGARAARPLGCRTFHCDPHSRRWGEPLHETLHTKIRSMHRRHGIAYHYDEWLRMLRLFGARSTEAAERP